MSVVRGKDFKLYRNSDEPYDNSPTWVLVTNVRDLKRAFSKAMADASVRGSDYKQQVATQKDLSIDFQMVYDGGADAIAFEDAFHDDTDLELLVLDGPIATSGSRGVRFMSQVSKFDINEALADVGMIDVTVVPGYYPTNLPRRVSVVTPGTVTDLS